MTHMLARDDDDDESASNMGGFQNGDEGEDVAPMLGGIDADSLTVTDRLVIHADNERAAPEILPYPAELLEDVQAELARRIADIQRMREAALTAPKRQAEEAEAALLGLDMSDGGNKRDAAADGGVSRYVSGVGGAAGVPLSSSLPFRVDDLLNLEVTRVKYAVADLIRVRLQKLQFFRDSIVAEPQRYERLLSENEMTLVERLQQLFDDAMLEGGMAQLPAAFRQTPPAALPRAIATDGSSGGVYVLATAIDDVEVPLAGLDVPQFMKSGSSILCPYASVRQHVLDGKMKLL